MKNRQEKHFPRTEKEYNKRINKPKIIIMIIGLVLFVIGTILCFVWYDWKIFIVLLILIMSYNISMRYKNELD
jgi:uncharacterized membrane protein YdbT with pleckstrin-like domain